MWKRFRSPIKSMGELKKNILEKIYNVFDILIVENFIIPPRYFFCVVTYIASETNMTATAKGKAFHLMGMICHISIKHHAMFVLLLFSFDKDIKSFEPKGAGQADLK